MTPTGKQIITAILRKRWHRTFCLPNYTPTGWWECDVFEVTNAGYFREYEVKTSHADFLRDAEKVQQVYPRAYGEPERFERKYDLLENGDPRAPAFFWYVTPVGLLGPGKVPRWAGLMEVIDGRYNPRVVKEAPRIHRHKFPEKSLQNARSVCYGRYHGIRVKHNEL